MQIIESGMDTKSSSLITTLVDFQEDMQFELTEPLNTFYKDEVRARYWSLVC